jgi:hypothetical protein
MWKKKLKIGFWGGRSSEVGGQSDVGRAPRTSGRAIHSYAAGIRHRPVSIPIPHATFSNSSNSTTLLPVLPNSKKFSDI